MRRFRKNPNYGNLSLTYLHPVLGEHRELVSSNDVILEGDWYSQFAEAGLMYEIFAGDAPVAKVPDQPARVLPRLSEAPVEMMFPYKLKEPPPLPVKAPEETLVEAVVEAMVTQAEKAGSNVQALAPKGARGKGKKKP